MYTVCVPITVGVYRLVGLGAGVAVFLRESVGHGVTVELYEGAVNVADGVREFLDVAQADGDACKDLEMRLVIVDKEEAVDVFDGGRVLVCVTDAVEVLEGATLLLGVRLVKAFVGEPRGLDEVVLDELILAVVVVEPVRVFVPIIVLEIVDDADVVLEGIPVIVVVTVLRVLGVLLELADPLGDPVDVLEPTMLRVRLDEPELVLEGCIDLLSVGEPVLVFDVLTLPVDVFVGGIVLDNLAEDVVVRLAAIV